MSDQDFLARTERFARHLAELGLRLDKESFALLLRILHGVNQALVHHSRSVDIPFGPGDRKLFTNELGRELETLMDLLGSHGMRMVVDVADSAGAGPDGGFEEPSSGLLAPAERDRDRREVEAIVRASGMQL
ncbi:hypothetical protein [Streptomyces silvisoli]|uniref:Uncharacterized protein n=1 Tax=Streptomyces silvisoli TaxID=3034235 RepID=A0ABT5ZFP7_9ACTN|nr:hypothetical protein [Streptomyces silvisoli]MDF3287813.1 hypothetical protein [Streptomyces silvisoli]